MLISTVELELLVSDHCKMFLMDVIRVAIQRLEPPSIDISVLDMPL
jgi:hypothetical protein